MVKILIDQQYVNLAIYQICHTPFYQNIVFVTLIFSFQRLNLQA